MAGTGLGLAATDPLRARRGRPLSRENEKSELGAPCRVKTSLETPLGVGGSGRRPLESADPRGPACGAVPGASTLDPRVIEVSKLELWGSGAGGENHTTGSLWGCARGLEKPINSLRNSLILASGGCAGTACAPMRASRRSRDAF